MFSSGSIKSFTHLALATCLRAFSFSAIDVGLLVQIACLQDSIMVLPDHLFS